LALGFGEELPKEGGGGFSSCFTEVDGLKAEQHDSGGEVGGDEDDERACGGEEFFENENAKKMTDDSARAG